MTADDDTRQDDQNARTQNVFREVNEAIADIGSGFGLGGTDEDPIEVVCECGRSDCFERIEVSGAAYEEIRSSGARFVLVSGHEVGTVEHVVYRTDTYVVAENHGRSEAIARDADPRTRH
jgi:hypothetical protein